MRTRHALADSLRALVDAEQRRAGVPGCAVVVVDNGDVLLCEGFGYRDTQSRRPVTAQTMFPIGSATKTFTAVVLAGLAAQGQLDLDAPIRTYLPGFALLDPVASEQASVRDCLSHRSGLPRHDLLWQAGDGVLTPRDVVDALAHLPPSKGFRADYQYNNLLYIAAGELVAVLTGSALEDVVAEQILRPLGMTRTTFSLAATQREPDHATPYIRHGHDEGATPIPFATLGLAAAAGGLNSAAIDMVPWLRTLTGHGHDGRDPLLAVEVLAGMRSPAISMPLDAAGPVVPAGYGMGLILEDYRGSRISHHGGNIDGFSSEILTREDGIGVAVLCNLHATWMRDALPYLILDTLDGVPSPDHGTFFRDRLAAKFAAAEASKPQPPTADRPCPPTRPLQTYTGRYRHPAYGECVVGHGPDGLSWEYRNLPRGTFAHRHADFFEIELRINGSEIALAAEFATGDAGSVDELRVALEAAVPPIQFVRVG